MLAIPDFAWRDLAVLALILWLFYRYAWAALGTTLIVLGLITLVLLPADLYLSLLPLGLTGAGFGVLVHNYQQRQATLRRQAHMPRTYTRPHDEFHT